VLLFSDIPADTIYQLEPPDTRTVFRSPSGNSNGLGLDPDGGLLAAEHGGRRVSRDDVTVVDDYQGMRLNSPNDVIARSDGTIYFTDPPYGISDADRELPFMGVFRVVPGAIQPLADWEGPLSARPNGIALSPDESILYVADTADGMLRAWDIAPDDGSLSGERVLSAEVPGADGMAVDTAGNLFVTTSLGVRVIAPDGTTWGTIGVPEQPANCAFGGDDGRTLYITARTSLYRVELARAGLPTH
jgi:gluconolactonase